MKQTKISIIAPFFLFVAGCYNSNVQDFKPQKPDTVKTAIIYINPQNENVTGAKVYKVVKDSLFVDTANNSMRWRRDSDYYVPFIYQRVDSLKHPVKDSFDVKFVLLPNRKQNLLTDYNKKY